MRFRLDPLAPNGVSAVPDLRVRTTTNAVPRLQTLNDLQDVVLTSTPSDNQALAYDTATGKWIPQTLAGGGGGGTWGSITGTVSDQTDLQTLLNAKVSATTLLTNGKGYVTHGVTASTARPTSFASIEWYGSVQPTNAVEGDTWIDTT